MNEFEEANKAEHPVEKEWHYKILTKYGFIPETKSAIGFVRSYTYNHPDGHKIKCNTGINADYWSGMNGGGYWSELEPHILKIINKS